MQKTFFLIPVTKPFPVFCAVVSRIAASQRIPNHTCFISDFLLFLLFLFPPLPLYICFLSLLRFVALERMARGMPPPLPLLLLSPLPSFLSPTPLPPSCSFSFYSSSFRWLSLPETIFLCKQYQTHLESVFLVNRQSLFLPQFLGHLSPFPGSIESGKMRKI